ncbi:MAG: acetyl-CoA carboxylase biotin carboxyl carrier protein [Fusobacteriaceae bacterium]
MKKYITATEELMKILSSQKLTELNYEEEGFKLTLKKPFNQSLQMKNIKNNIETKKSIPVQEILKEVFSEGIGYFYPTTKNDVSILEKGNIIEPGSEIGYILTMGVKTPVISYEGGTIEEICVLEGEPVDFNKCIIKLKK